jgi:hypothetical protein
MVCSPRLSTRQVIVPSTSRADHPGATIARERLAPGDQLPSEAQLMAHYGAAQVRWPGRPCCAFGQGRASTDQAEAAMWNGGGGKSCAHRVRRARRCAWFSWLT